MNKRINMFNWQSDKYLGSELAAMDGKSATYEIYLALHFHCSLPFSL